MIPKPTVSPDVARLLDGNHDARVRQLLCELELEDVQNRLAKARAACDEIEAPLAELMIEAEEEYVHGLNGEIFHLKLTGRGGAPRVEMIRPADPDCLEAALDRRRVAALLPDPAQSRQILAEVFPASERPNAPAPTDAEIDEAARHAVRRDIVAGHIGTPRAHVPDLPDAVAVTEDDGETDLLGLAIAADCERPGAQPDERFFPAGRSGPIRLGGSNGNGDRAPALSARGAGQR